MSRLLGLSPLVLCSRCKHCSQNSGCFFSSARAQLLSERALQRRSLTPTPRGLYSNNNGKRHFWVLGIGAGVLLALGLKYHVYSRERCECERCECETTVRAHSNSRYSAAIETSRDLLQRVKVQVASHELYYSVTAPPQRPY